MITRVVFEFAFERVVSFSGHRRVERMRIGAAPSVRPVPFFQRWRACEPGEEPTAWWTEADARESTDGGCWEPAPLGDVPPELLMTLGQLLAGGPRPRMVIDPQYAGALVIKLGVIDGAPFQPPPPSQRVPEPGPCTEHAHHFLSGFATCQCGQTTRAGDCRGWYVVGRSDSEDGGEPRSRQTHGPRATQKGAATPGQEATAQGAVPAAGNVAEPQSDPTPDRTGPPPSSTSHGRDIAEWLHEDLVRALGYAPGSVTWSRCLSLVRETIGQRNEARTERDALTKSAEALRAQLAAIAGIARESDIDASLGIIRRAAQYLLDENEGRRWPRKIDTLDTLAQALVNDLKQITGAHDRLAAEAQDLLVAEVRPARGDYRIVGGELEGESSIVVNIVTDNKRHLPRFLIKRRSDTTTALGTFFKIRCKTCHAWRPDNVADTVVAISKHLREAHGYELGWRWIQRPAMEADWLVSLE